MNSTSTPNSLNSQDKDKYFRNQLQTIFHYLVDHIATASMVEDATGVPQKNICRYKRDLERLGELQVVKKDYCKRTGFKAWFLTTNKELFRKSNDQLKMFNDGE